MLFRSYLIGTKNPKKKKKIDAKKDLKNNPSNDPFINQWPPNPERKPQISPFDAFQIKSP